MEEYFLVPSVHLGDKFGFIEKILDKQRNIFYITEEIQGVGYEIFITSGRASPPFDLETGR